MQPDVKMPNVSMADEERKIMKAFLGMVILLCVLSVSAGCHSGTTRGIGSDISRLGDNMQE